MDKINDYGVYDIAINGKALKNLRKIQKKLRCSNFSSTINKLAKLLYIDAVDNDGVENEVIHTK